MSNPRYTSLKKCKGVPMEKALTPEQCDKMRGFILDLISAAHRPQNKFDPQTLRMAHKYQSMVMD